MDAPMLGHKARVAYAPRIHFRHPSQNVSSGPLGEALRQLASVEWVAKEIQFGIQTSLGFKAVQSSIDHRMRPKQRVTYGRMTLGYKDAACALTAH